MTTLEQAARQALEALIWTTGSTDFGKFGHAHEGALKLLFPAIDALRQALEQPKQEPVAKVQVKTTGGNAGLATQIVEIDDPLRERLQPGQLLYTEQPKQEPVAYSCTSRITGVQTFSLHPKPPHFDSDSWDIKPLYTSYRLREWVGLTDEEVRTAYCTISDKEWAIGGMNDAEPFARAIEAKLKEKNT